MLEAFKLKAAAKREEAQAKGSLAEMPASLNGKVLSASMQNGALICEAFQTKICPLPLEKESCSGRHACAVMHKAGRVCGGGHSACECHDKTFIKVEGSLGAQQWPDLFVRIRNLSSEQFEGMSF